MREAVWGGGQTQPWCNDIILTPHVTQNPQKTQEVWVWLCKAATVFPWTEYQCAQTLCIHLIWMKEAVWGGCQSQSGRTDNILTPQVTQSPRGYNCVRLLSYAHGQHINMLKHFVCFKYRCKKQFEVAISLNHDLLTSFWLHKLPHPRIWVK